MYLKISRQGLTGARELRKRVRPFRAASFLHRPSGGLELPQAGSPLTGGKFSAEPQRGDSPSADGGNVPRPAEYNWFINPLIVFNALLVGLLDQTGLCGAHQPGVQPER